MIYLDNNATTKISPDVFDAMKPYFMEKYGNPSSLHSFGTDILPAMQTALDTVYQTINAHDEDDVIITSGATEANNHVLQGIVIPRLLSGHTPHIIVSKIEHHCVLHTAQFLESKGCEVSYLSVNKDGQIRPEDLKACVQDNTVLISLMQANNETGIIHDIKALVTAKNEINPSILFHTDGVQAMGKIPVDVQDLGVDYFSLTAHKFHGPKGIGALFMKKGKTLPAFIHGGGQMGNLRSGTENVPGIVGLGKACKNIPELIQTEQSVIKALHDEFETFVKSNISDIIIAGETTKRTPNTSFIAFAGVEWEGLIWDLNKQGIAVSTGSACASSDLEWSHVLRAMTSDPELGHTGIRFSFGQYNTKEDLEHIKATLPKAVERLRAISCV